MTRYTRPITPTPEAYYDHFPLGEDMRDHIAPTAADWLRFRQEISENGAAGQKAALDAIGYIIAHVLGGKFPPKPSQASSFWGGVAQAAFDWYYFAVGHGSFFTLGQKSDPAVHYRALRFVVVSVAGLRSGPA